jgi:predicted hydrolase (HD superfamily)
MSLTRTQAWDLLCEWTQSDALRTHARSVEIVMHEAATHYGQEGDEPELWGLAGLLHDADYEKWPEKHPTLIVQWLLDKGEPRLAHAISAHYTKWGVSYDSLLDKALLACDELTGFIGACTLVRPDGIASLTPKSVNKKLKDKRFAAKVERDEVHAGVEFLGVDLHDHIQFIIDALKPHAAELGLMGSAQS